MTTQEYIWLRKQLPELRLPPVRQEGRNIIISDENYECREYRLEDFKSIPDFVAWRRSVILIVGTEIHAEKYFQRADCES